MIMKKSIYKNCTVFSCQFVKPEMRTFKKYWDVKCYLLEVMRPEIVHCTVYI